MCHQVLAFHVDKKCDVYYISSEVEVILLHFCESGALDGIER